LHWLAYSLALLCLFGCQSTPNVPDTVDTTTLQTITRPQAIEYLRQVAAKHTDLGEQAMALHGNAAPCTYLNAGIADVSDGGARAYGEWRYTSRYGGGGSLTGRYAMVRLTHASWSGGNSRTCWALFRKVEGLTPDVREQFTDATTALTVVGVKKSPATLPGAH
jgi:hypothetical protein